MPPKCSFSWEHHTLIVRWCGVNRIWVSCERKVWKAQPRIEANFESATKAFVTVGPGHPCFSSAYLRFTIWPREHSLGWEFWELRLGICLRWHRDRNSSTSELCLHTTGRDHSRQIMLSILALLAQFCPCFVEVFRLSGRPERASSE